MNAVKPWPCNEHCQVLETITKDAKIKVGSSGIAPVRFSTLTFAGADVQGRAYGESFFGERAAATACRGDGSETHMYVVQVDPGCRLIRCKIRVECKAHGGFTGTLQDNDMHVSGDAQVNVCGTNFPLSITVDPKLDAGEDKKKVKVKSSGASEGNESELSGGIEFEWEWRKTTGNVGTVSLPPVRFEHSLSCEG